SGNALNTYEYDIWGNLIADKVKETMPNPFAYAGEMYDKESNFYYLRARYYDPKMGRFVSEDTYKGQVDNPLTLNRYMYVHNNPLRFIDPSGQKPQYVYDKTDGRYYYSSSIEFFDGTLTAFGYVPFGSLVAEGTKQFHEEMRNYSRGDIKVLSLSESEEFIRGYEFATLLDLTGDKGKYVSPFLKNFTGYLGMAITTGNLFELWANETEMDDLVGDLFMKELISAKSEEIISEKYYIATAYLQSQIHSGKLVYKYEGTLKHNLSKNDLIQMHADLIQIFDKMGILDK
ncbi:RHS repeat-associated core domain-containing protein, partial [Brevibacillus parabrevis]|uniref:RHS repeat-associated core domain-containing protein n=1 Tax=Brevibacillus parabrevis TaxID=54914 RepID=UPI0020B1A1F1